MEKPRHAASFYLTLSRYSAHLTHREEVGGGAGEPDAAAEEDGAAKLVPRGGDLDRLFLFFLNVCVGG